MSGSSPPSAARLADMLGQVRDEIKFLKLRDAAIRDQILGLYRNAPIEGAQHVVTVKRAVRRSFDAKRLPAQIRDDPRYWRESESLTVTAKPRDAGGPAKDHTQTDEEDIQLIE